MVLPPRPVPDVLERGEMEGVDLFQAPKPVTGVGRHGLLELGELPVIGTPQSGAQFVGEGACFGLVRRHALHIPCRPRVMRARRPHVT